jgi:hypothetical protein
MDRIMKTDDPDMLDALLELLAVVAPTEEEEKYKHEMAWAAIDHGYKRTDDCRKSGRRYLGVAS